MIAAGCLVQWYEVDMFEEYLDSLVCSIGEQKDKVSIDMCLCTNQDLEQIDDQVDMLTYVIEKYLKLCNRYKLEGYDITSSITKELYTIADYRRDFNERYCEVSDIIFWGESDMLVPSQAIETILSLHTAVKDQTPKWLGFFATCKMWDDSWKVLEHPKLTDLPRDPYAWYGTRAYMKYSKMEEINSDVTSPDILSTYNYKFNGCGLIMSSELIRSGINIPRSVFFTHEDTALMNNMLVTFGNQQIPFYIIKNILLVHNREHPRKRRYVKGEAGENINEQRKSNAWYRVASEMSKHNAYTFMKQDKTYKWEDVWQAL